MIRDFIVGYYGEYTYQVIEIFLRFYPIWLPLLLGYAFWETWVRYVRYIFFTETEMTLLEVRIPREQMKSPMAMEIVLNAFYNTSRESTWIDKFWKGQVRPYFSLEIAAIKGQVRFFIWTREGLRNIIEASIYSQYPNVEVRVVDDYTKKVKYDPKVNEVWAGNYVLEQPDPLPIKTYVDYGLDKDPKEEFKNDPLSSLIEYLGSLKPSEEVWLQFVIQAHKKEKMGGLFSKKKDWRTEVDTIRQGIIDKIKESGRNTPSRGEGEIIESLERNFKKVAFNCGIRCVYIAPKNIFSMGSSVAGLRGMFRPFGSGPWNDIEKIHYAGFNSLKGNELTDFDYPWEDFNKMRMTRKKRKKVDAYKRRMFFYAPYKEKVSIYTSEELATLYHFPGETSASPALERIPSKRSQAPANLPI